MQSNRLKILMLNCYHLCHELRLLGHEVFTVTWGSKDSVERWNINISDYFVDLNTILELLPAEFKPTNIVYQDSSAAPYIRGLEKTQIPTTFYAIDTHIHGFWQRYFALGFDSVLLAQKDALNSFLDVGCNAQWLPLWAMNLQVPEKEKTIEVCFRGSLDIRTHPERVKFFNRLSELWPGDYGLGPYTEAYPHAKIVINEALNKEVNFRVFEAMMAGALLITPAIESGMTELFTAGQHMVTYEDGNAEDAARKIRYFLNNEEERQRIAHCGHLETLTKHAPAVRASQLAAALRKTSSCVNSFKLLGPAYAYLTFVESYIGLDGNLTRRYVGQVIEALKNYADSGGEVSELFLRIVLKCQFLLEITQGLELSRELIENLRFSYQDEKFLILSHLHVLLKLGLTAEAESLALQFNTDTSKVFRQVERVFSSFRLSNRDPRGTLQTG